MYEVVIRYKLQSNRVTIEDTLKKIADKYNYTGFGAQYMGLPHTMSFVRGDLGATFLKEEEAMGFVRDTLALDDIVGVAIFPNKK